MTAGWSGHWWKNYLWKKIHTKTEIGGQTLSANFYFLSPSSGFEKSCKGLVFSVDLV